MDLYYAQVNIAQDYSILNKVGFVEPMTYSIDKARFYDDKNIIAVGKTEKQCIKRMDKYLQMHPIKNSRYFSGTGYYIIGDIFYGDNMGFDVPKPRTGFLSVHKHEIRKEAEFSDSC